MTALTTEGSIVVANSYGIGYVPAKVLLPEQVQLASGDGSIAVATRAQWATYPILALQGWARHRKERLRLLIATEDQLRGCDPGTATSILQPDDFPESGTMRGRNRLEVLAPDSAATLAATQDMGLTGLLPAAQAGPEPSAGDLAMSWLEVGKPLMSESSDRARVHLEAMASHAVHAMRSALCQAQVEPDAGVLRAAIADWLYWGHQHRILAAALEAPARQV